MKPEGSFKVTVNNLTANLLEGTFASTRVWPYCWSWAAHDLFAHQVWFNSSIYCFGHKNRFTFFFQCYWWRQRLIVSSGWTIIIFGSTCFDKFLLEHVIQYVCLHMYDDKCFFFFNFFILLYLHIRHPTYICVVPLSVSTCMLAPCCVDSLHCFLEITHETGVSVWCSLLLLIPAELVNLSSF